MGVATGRVALPLVDRCCGLPLLLVYLCCGLSLLLLVYQCCRGLSEQHVLRVTYATHATPISGFTAKQMVQRLQHVK